MTALPILRYTAGMASPQASVELQLPIHTYDIDFAGIVSNIVYIRWLEELRTRLLDVTLPLRDQLDAGYTPVLLTTEIQYRRALRLFDEPVGRMWVETVGRVRCTVAAEITVGDAVVATAGQTLAWVSLSDLRPRAVPVELRTLNDS